VENLASFYCSFYHCSGKNDLTFNDILIRNRKFSIELLVILEFAGRSEKIQEAAQKIKIFEGDIRNKKDRKHILR
jgi:hypothetical protein